MHCVTRRFLNRVLPSDARGFGRPPIMQIEKALPRTKALIDLLNKAQPVIEQAHSLR
jgi:hypothetical protein